MTRARELRRRQTVAEAKLWYQLRRKNLFGEKFRRQHPIGSYIVDLYCEKARLVVEIDGGGHADEAQRRFDAARTAELERQGLRILRFWNTEVLGNLNGVLQRISEASQRSPS